MKTADATGAGPIAGYRTLGPAEVYLINEVKVKAEEVRLLLERVQHTAGVDARSVAIARTELQTGFMWLVRAIAQPTTF